MNWLKFSVAQKWALFGLVIVACIILFSFKYKLVSSNGEFYRINEITGEVLQIQGTRFIAIDKLSEIKKLALGQLKEWDTQKIGKNSDIDVDIKTIWRNGKLYYDVKVYPYDKIEKIQKKHYLNALEAGIIIIFMDNNKFTIKEIPINFRDMILSISTNVLGISNSIELSYEDMKYIDDIEVTWKFAE